MKLPKTWLTAAAVLALTGASLSACSDAPDEQPKGERSRYVVPAGPQPVRAPQPADRLDLDTPVRPEPVSSPRKPNLLMITLDDASAADMEHMPHLQRLVADQGVTLEDGLAPTPICVPARASLLTGQNAGNHGALTINGEGGGFEAFDDADTLPVWLQDAGYHTMFVGKYLNHYGQDGSQSYVPPGWDDWRGTIDPTTYNFLHPSFNVNGDRLDYDEYVTDVESRHSTQMIERAADITKPWYLWVNHVAPHHGGKPTPDDPEKVFPDDPKPLATTTPAKRDQDSFDDLPLPDKPNMFEDTSDKGIVKAARKRWSDDRRQQLTEVNQQRVESLQSVDRSIRDTMRTLRRTGQLDETYVVVTSDNGFTVGEHNLAEKLWYFREILNVPMIIRGPGLPKGTTSTAPVTNADWAPTFAALAGATPTRDVDGTNVLPYLTTDAAQRVVPIEAYPVKGGRTPLYTGVTVGPWTYVEGKGGRPELYYREVDPYENSNLGGDPRYAKQRKELARLADRYVGCAGSECPDTFYR